ncbi:hypothetical protein C2G38_2216689 [Gigaspora rosea]|uniref:Uncharacterized protein n=1 Tax=Gigaspora rosea TaxID=44941 RepID=A0A397U8G8_9GLOM|nr:hypothetical protein C2G38_2216689 [Gigaspora rosea]
MRDPSYRSTDPAWFPSPKIIERIQKACASLVGRQECVVGAIVEAIVSVCSCLVLKNSVGYCYCPGIGVEKNEHKASIL